MSLSATIITVDDGTTTLEAISGVDAEVVVLVGTGLVLPQGWLDDLLAPLADPSVAASGPVFADGNPAQRVSVDLAAGASDAEIAAHAAAWRLDHADVVHAANTLEPWCVAVRADLARTCDLTGLGAWDEAAAGELCRQLAVRGYQLVVVERTYAHRRGAPVSAPVSAQDEIGRLMRVAAAGRRELLLSAALIVKDEEDNLPKCLASLSGLVDEVVVYDTGSTDRTVDIARRAGAVVIEGYWDDDFSRARNEAISRCTGEWVLSIDADEIATGDASAVRCALEVNWGVDVLVVQITNVLGGAAATRAGLDHQGPRLLRRSRCRWRLRLHVQPYTPPDEPPMRGGRMSHLRLLHTGYTDDAAATRDKIERNIRVAEEGLAELADPEPGELVANLVNLGRSYTWAGRNEDALGCYERAVAIDGPSGYRRAALTHGFEALMALGRLEKAEDWLRRLQEASSETSLVPRYLEGLLLFRRGDVAGALERFDGIEALGDDDGTARGADFVAKVRGMAYLAARDWPAALESLMLAATSGGAPAWGPMAIAAANAVADVGVVAALVTPDGLLTACAEIVTCVPALAPAFLEHLWGRFPADPVVLGAAARIGPSLGVGRALEWSARLRAAGAADRCPLRAIVAATAAPGVERLRAAAVLESAFGEAQAESSLRAIISGLDDDGRARVTADLEDLCPRLAHALTQLSPSAV